MNSFSEEKVTGRKAATADRRVAPTLTDPAEPIVQSTNWRERDNGAIAQLGERLLCKQEVVGSIPSGSTICLMEPRR